MLAKERCDARTVNQDTLQCKPGQVSSVAPASGGDVLSTPSKKSLLTQSLALQIFEKRTFACYI